MQIRVATESDIPTIVRFRAQLWDSYLTEITSADFPDWPARAAAALADLLPRDTHRFLVADDAYGRPLGMVSAALELRMPGFAWPGVHATLNDMWVEEDARGGGVARALMDEILAWVRAAGARKVKLHSTPGARAAYERLGFHVGVPQPGDEKYPVMWLDFPEDA